MTAVAVSNDVGFPLPAFPKPTQVPSSSTMAARVDEPPTSTARYFIVAVACPGVRTKLAMLGVLVAAGLTACGGDDGGPDDAEATDNGGLLRTSICRRLAMTGERRHRRSPSIQRRPGRSRSTRRAATFVVTLDPESAPATAASLVALAEAGFYDDTVFHRIVPGFVIQGGDPTQTGGGGPGYQTVDVPADDAAYTHGVVAMAKAGPEPPGTAGSQFFVVTGADVGLPARLRHRRRGHRRT